MKYSISFKKSVLRRVLSPNNEPISKVSEDIEVDTLINFSLPENTVNDVFLQRDRRLAFVVLEKPVGPYHVGQLWPKHFHGDFPVVLHIPCEVDGGHPARTDLSLDLIAIGEGDLEPGRNVFSHRDESGCGSAGR